MVHGRGEEAVEGLGGVAAGQQLAAEGGERLEPGHPEQRCLGEGGPHLVQTQGRSTWSAPAHPVDERSRAGPCRERMPLLETVELCEHVGAQGDQPAPREVR